MAGPFKLKSGNSPSFKNMGSSPARHSSWKADDMGIAHNEMYGTNHTNEDHPMYWTPISEYSDEELAELKETREIGEELIDKENEKTRKENEKKQYNIELDKKIEEEFRQRDERRKQKLLDIEAMKKEKSEKGIFGDFLPDWFKRY